MEKVDMHHEYINTTSTSFLGLKGTGIYASADMPCCRNDLVSSTSWSRNSRGTIYVLIVTHDGG
jgi:hypothetical protein